MNKFVSGLIAVFSGAGILRSLTAGLLIGFLALMDAVTFAALIYSGDLSSFTSHGIGFFLMQNMVMIVFVVLFSSYAGFIAVGQDSTAAILALAVATLLVFMPRNAPGSAKFSTAVVMIFLTTIATGLFLLILGRFKLGGLVRFLPYPVVGGYLAGTGWLLLVGGIGLMANTAPGLELLQAGKLALWIPGLLYSIVLLYVLARVDHPAVMPLMILGGVCLFYLVVWLAGIPLNSLGDSGLLFGPFPETRLWNLPLNLIFIEQIDWNAITHSALVASPILMVAVMTLLLNAGGMELEIQRDIDLNSELSVAGWGNLLTGLVGGIPAYQTISYSSLNYRLSGGRRASAVVAALVCGVMLLFGASVLSYIPKVLIGALLAYFGLFLLFEWVYKTWFKFPLVEYLVVVLILGMIAVFGFLVGVLVGVVLAIILFVVSYSRTDVIKHSLSGLYYRSRVTRTPDQQKVLAQHGERLYILQLQGFIFFGTANTLLEKVRNQVECMDIGLQCYFLLDFRRVTGLDSTAMLSFAKMKQHLIAKNIIAVLTGLSPAINKQFVKGDIIADNGKVLVFPDLDRGLEWCEEAILKSLDAPEEDKTLSDYLMAILPEPEHIPDLISAMHRIQIEEGYILIQQGDVADTLFFVEKGQVTAQLAVPDSDPIRLETMRGGRVVGEIGFYLGTKRTASVVADQSSNVYAFTTEDLRELERSDPGAAAAFHRVVASLLAERVVHLVQTVAALQR